MKRILSGTQVPTKFAKGLSGARPYAQIYRKSGTWRTYHSDSALIEHDGRTYIAAALSDNPAGAEWLSRLIVALDHVILETKPYADSSPAVLEAAAAAPSRTRPLFAPSAHPVHSGRWWTR